MLAPNKILHISNTPPPVDWQLLSLELFSLLYATEEKPRLQEEPHLLVDRLGRIPVPPPDPSGGCASFSAMN